MNEGNNGAVKDDGVHSDSTTGDVFQQRTLSHGSKYTDNWQNQDEVMSEENSREMQ